MTRSFNRKGGRPLYSYILSHSIELALRFTAEAAEIEALLPANIVAMLLFISVKLVSGAALQLT